MMKKKLVLVLLLSLGLLCISYAFKEFKYANEVKANVKTEKIRVDYKYGQCWAIAKSTGNRCRHCVSNSGDYYCWQHQ